MVTSPLRRILCLLGRHKRSRSRVQTNPDYVTSVCRHCGIPMCKYDGKWRVER